MHLSAKLEFGESDDVGHLGWGWSIKDAICHTKGLSSAL